MLFTSSAVMGSSVSRFAKTCRRTAFSRFLSGKIDLAGGFGASFFSSGFFSWAIAVKVAAQRTDPATATERKQEVIVFIGFLSRELSENLSKKSNWLKFAALRHAGERSRCRIGNDDIVYRYENETIDDEDDDLPGSDRHVEFQLRECRRPNPRRPR